MIRILSDSTCDFSRKDLDTLGVETVPLMIHFGGESFLDGVDISHQEFYRKLRAADTLPTTSQANPDQFEKVYTKYAQTQDELVVITISSKLSATFHSAQSAAEGFKPGTIHLVDSGSVSFGTQLLIREAVRLRDEGKLSAEGIARSISALVPRLRLYALLDTLRYLKLGGRLSGGAALIGGLLRVKPVVRCLEGKIEAVDKVRGSRAGLLALTARFREDGPDLPYGLSFSSADNREGMEEALSAFAPLVGNARIHTGGMGSVIGTHAGPGAVGVAWIVQGG